jgi:hypothetical protein
MLIFILVILFIVWIFRYGAVSLLPFPLFNLLGHVITLWDIIIFLLIIWLIGILPSPFGEIASVAFILWILAVLGIIAIAGISNLIIIAILIGLLLYILRF